MERVLLGMSGGVDSSVAAYLLKEEGYEVVGVTMTLIDKENDTSVIDAKKVCEKLGIEHYVLDLKEEFHSEIIGNFINSYVNALTPNPCVLCNKKFKFGLLWEKALELGCSYIATGHYADIKDGHICKIDSGKDQSYFLYGINRDVISHIVFPLSKYDNKEDIRNIASRIGLDVASKKDSQDICFIENGKYVEFLENNLDKLPDMGDFIFEEKVIGKHKGIVYYTIGQRKGLGISYEHPLYVIGINKEDNVVILGKEEDLYSKEVYIRDVNILLDEIPNKCMGKIRYKSKLTSCRIEKIDDNNMKVIFDEPVKSVTPGQSLVLYDGYILVGGGIIVK